MMERDEFDRQIADLNQYTPAMLGLINADVAWDHYQTDPATWDNYAEPGEPELTGPAAYAWATDGPWWRDHDNN